MTSGTCLKERGERGRKSFLPDGIAEWQLALIPYLLHQQTCVACVCMCMFPAPSPQNPEEGVRTVIGRTWMSG